MRLASPQTQFINLKLQACSYANSYELHSILLLVLIEVVNDSCWSVSTNPLILVAITITALSERLIAVHASVGPRTPMGAHVIHYVAELVELFLAGQALQNLIKPTCLRVHNLSFSVSFIFADRIPQVSFF